MSDTNLGEINSKASYQRGKWVSVREIIGCVTPLALALK